MIVLTSNLLIVAPVFCFRNQKIMLSIGYTPVIVLPALTALRFLFPFELPFARNIHFCEGLSVFVAFVQHCEISKEKNKK